MLGLYLNELGSHKVRLAFCSVAMRKELRHGAALQMLHALIDDYLLLRTRDSIVIGRQAHKCNLASKPARVR